MLRLTALVLAAQASVSTMIDVPSGVFRPLYGRAGDPPAAVAAFRIDRDAVTVGDYLAFVRANPEWRRSAARTIFAARGDYLAEWNGDLVPNASQSLRAPVVAVSWFAARAYCASRDARLPTMLEWEYTAAASATRRDAARDRAFIQQLVTWYATRSSRSSPVDSAETNAFGVRGLHSLAAEWVDDFNGVLVSDDSRAIGGRDHDQFCASAAIGAADPSNYPAFLRQALRAGLSGRSALSSLGFRCAA